MQVGDEHVAAPATLGTGPGVRNLQPLGHTADAVAVAVEVVHQPRGALRRGDAHEREAPGAAGASVQHHAAPHDVGELGAQLLQLRRGHLAEVVHDEVRQLARRLACFGAAIGRRFAEADDHGADAVLGGTLGGGTTAVDRLALALTLALLLLLLLLGRRLGWRHERAVVTTLHAGLLPRRRGGHGRRRVPRVAEGRRVLRHAHRRGHAGVAAHYPVRLRAATTSTSTGRVAVHRAADGHAGHAAHRGGNHGVGLLGRGWVPAVRAARVVQRVRLGRGGGGGGVSGAAVVARHRGVVHTPGGVGKDVNRSALVVRVHAHVLLRSVLRRSWRASSVVGSLVVLVLMLVRVRVRVRVSATGQLRGPPTLPASGGGRHGVHNRRGRVLGVAIQVTATAGVRAEGGCRSTCGRPLLVLVLVRTRSTRGDGVSMARCSRHGSRWWLRRARRCLLSAGEGRAGHAGAAGNHAARAGGWGTAAHERIPRRIAAGGVWGTHTTTRSAAGSAGSGRAAKRRLLVQPRRRWPAVAAVVAVGSPRGGLWHDRRTPVVGRGR